MLRRRGDSMHTTDEKAEKRHISSNAKEKLRAFFHLERPLIANLRYAGCSSGAIEPSCGRRSENATCECNIFYSHTAGNSACHGSNTYQSNHTATFHFYALPREIRDEIIRQIFIPGSIYLENLSGRWGLRRPLLENRYKRLTGRLQTKANDTVLQFTRQIDRQLKTFPHPRFRRIGGSPSSQQPGIQLLATSKDMYAQGHALFYSHNRFHLPPGPITVSSSYFARLQPKHRDLIRSLVLTFSIADLSPEGFQRVDEVASRYRAMYRRQISSLSREVQIAVWTESSICALKSIWRHKLRWLLNWPTLRLLSDVTLVGAGLEYHLRGADVAEALARVDPGDVRTHSWYFTNDCTDVARPLLRALYARGRLVARGRRVAGGGWLAVEDAGQAGGVMGDECGSVDVETAKDWLSELGPRLRCEY